MARDREIYECLQSNDLIEFIECTYGWSKLQIILIALAPSIFTFIIIILLALKG